MGIRSYMPVMFAEHWVYVLALVNLAVVIALLYVVKAPINFGIW